MMYSIESMYGIFTYIYHITSTQNIPVQRSYVYMYFYLYIPYTLLTVLFEAFPSAEWFKPPETQ